MHLRQSEQRGLEALADTLELADKENWNKAKFDELAERALDIAPVNLAPKPKPRKTNPTPKVQGPKRLPPGPGKKWVPGGDFIADQNINYAKDRRTEYEELRDVLKEAIESLPGDQPAILRSVYLEQRTMKETAQMLGIPLGTIKSAVSRALVKLRENASLRDFFEYLDKMRDSP